jgi:hypothetical protein
MNHNHFAASQYFLTVEALDIEQVFVRIEIAVAFLIG